MVRQSAAGRNIARKILKPGVRGLEFAKHGSAQDAILQSVDQLRAEGTEVTHFQINSARDAIATYGGRWLFLAHLESPLEF